MKRTLILVLCLLLTAVALTSCNPDASSDTPQPGPTSYGVFKVGETKYRTLQKAVNAVKNANTAKAASVPTIVLIGDVEDAGAVIDIDVNLDFGSYSYTLKKSSTGIIIDAEDDNVPSVSIKGGVFKASTNDSELKSLFIIEGRLTLNNSDIDLTGTRFNAIETTTGGKIDIKGEGSILVDDASYIVKANGGSVVVDEEANVELKGSFNLDNGAVVDLAKSNLVLTKAITKTGEGTAISIKDKQGNDYTPNPAAFAVKEKYIAYQTPVEQESERHTQHLPYYDYEIYSLYVNFALKTLEVTVNNVAEPYDVYEDEHLVYQWYKGSYSDKSGAQPIPGATQPTYTPGKSDFTSNSEYYYYCNVKNGWLGGDGVDSPVAWVVYTGLPTLYITLDDHEIEIEPELNAKDSDIYTAYRKASFVLSTSDNYEIAPTDDYFASLGFEPKDKTKIPIEIKGRGNTSWTDTLKKGYNIKFEKIKDIYNDKVDHKPSVLGLKGAKKWCIIANFFDKSLIRNWVTSELSKAFTSSSEWTPSYKFVDFVINGKYLGNYVVAEAIQINKNRLYIKSIEDCTNDADFETKGGFLLEVDFREEEGEHLFRSSVYEIPFSAKDPDLEDIDSSLRDAAVEFMKSKINAVDAELSATNFVTKNVSEIKSFDVDSFVDWYILEEIAKSIDSDFHTSVYVYYNPVDKKIHMGPHWDFDRSLGSYSREYDAPISKSLSNTSGFWVHNHRLSTNPSYPHDYRSWFERILQNESFKVAIKTRWKEIRGNFSDISGKIDALSSELKDSANLNFTRWAILGEEIRDGEVNYASLDTYEEQIAYLKTWLTNRIIWLDEKWGN